MYAVDEFAWSTWAGQRVVWWQVVAWLEAQGYSLLGTTLTITNYGPAYLQEQMALVIAEWRLAGCPGLDPDALPCSV